MQKLLKRFDVHLKTVDGVGQQTYFGAVITICSIVIVSLLFFSELKLLFKTDVESYVLPDHSVGIDELRLSFDFEFPYIPCERLSFIHEVLRGENIHSGADELVRKVHLRNPQTSELTGCQIYGSKLTEKLGGSFQFKVDPEPLTLEVEEEEGKTESETHEFARHRDVLYHRINRLMFVGLDLDDDSEFKMTGHYPLNGYSWSDPNIEIGAKHYDVKVVPTIYKGLNGTVNRVNQYSVTDRTVDVTRTTNGVILGGQVIRGFIGVVVTYDFYPVMLIMEENKEAFATFMASFVGIVGGVMTILSLLDKCVYQSSKALMGKND